MEPAKISIRSPYFHLHHMLRIYLFKLNDLLHNPNPNKVNVTPTKITPLVPRMIEINYNK